MGRAPPPGLGRGEAVAVRWNIVLEGIGIAVLGLLAVLAAYAVVLVVAEAHGWRL